MRVGKRIYYDLITGLVLVDTGERQGAVKQTTVEQDIEVYKSLSERNRNTFGYLEFDYGQHRQNFMECNGYRVNVETKELEFSYPNPNNPDTPQEFGPPLTKQIEELRTENYGLMMAVAELGEASDKDKLETKLAIAELSEILIGGLNNG